MNEKEAYDVLEEGLMNWADNKLSMDDFCDLICQFRDYHKKRSYKKGQQDFKEELKKLAIGDKAKMMDLNGEEYVVFKKKEFDTLRGEDGEV